MIKLYGKKVTINSAHRSKKHNKKVGGASNSWHLHKCGARDVSLVGLDVKAFINHALKYQYRVIEYKNHIHVDVDEVKHLKGKY
jgi:uncharacterized protein YcbK (DUF882 family)